MSSITVKRTGKASVNPHRGRIGGKTFTRRPARKKNYPAGFAHRAGFLKQRLKIVPVKPDTYVSFFNEHLTEENFKYLAGCAVHHAGLLGQTIEMPTGSIHDKICILYHRFAEILPDGQKLNFEIANDRLTFLIYYVHPWNSCTFYWIPVGFINKFSGRFRDIALSFMHLFIRRNGLVRFKHSDEFEFMFEYLIENIQHDDYEASEKEELSDLLLSYKTGEISFLLDEVYDCIPLDVTAAMEDYKPTCPAEEKLLDGFRKGLPFISEGRIMNYDYNPFCDGFPEGYEEYEPVTLDRTIRYVHTLNDFISNELENMVNQDLQETYALEPTSFMHLQPDSKLFHPGDYPDRFSQWFLEMVNIITEITDHE